MSSLTPNARMMATPNLKMPRSRRSSPIASSRRSANNSAYSLLLISLSHAERLGYPAFKAMCHSHRLPGVSFFLSPQCLLP
jgi:hypothetical protein